MKCPTIRQMGLLVCEHNKLLHANNNYEETLFDCSCGFYSDGYGKNEEIPSDRINVAIKTKYELTTKEVMRYSKKIKKIFKCDEIEYFEQTPNEPSDEFPCWYLTYIMRGKR